MNSAVCGRGRGTRPSCRIDDRGDGLDIPFIEDGPQGILAAHRRSTRASFSISFNFVMSNTRRAP